MTETQVRSGRIGLPAAFAGVEAWGDLDGRVEFPPDVFWLPWGRCAGLLGPGRGVHLFVDDYRFQVSWRRPERALSRVRCYGAMVGPDFSVPWDSPLVFARWQAWRSAVVAEYWRREAGIPVLPVVMFWRSGGACAARPGSWVAVRGPQHQSGEALFQFGWDRTALGSGVGGVVVFGRLGRIRWGVPVLHVPLLGGVGERLLV
jgi:hypothetical protein